MQWYAGINIYNIHNIAKDVLKSWENGHNELNEKNEFPYYSQFTSDGV